MNMSCSRKAAAITRPMARHPLQPLMAALGPSEMVVIGAGDFHSGSWVGETRSHREPWNRLSCLWAGLAKPMNMTH